MKNIWVWAAAILILSLAGVDRALAAETDKQVQDALALFLKADPGLKKFLESAVGYAVFPDVTKGAIGIGAAHGGGCVYEKGKLVGTASLTQVTIGLALGGQSYAELIFFETPEALDSFKKSELAFSAQVSAVAAAEGVSSNAKYQLGVAVFTLARGGLMYEASLGGQKFKFKPLAQ
ncbi:MAG: YSC84-related protein [Verrucomicrobiia bacterium]|jgi:lipid-binding SYLF domain-containing protein